MTTISVPFGLRCVYHPSGEPRLATLEFGVTSGYATPLYNGSPVKLNDNGTLEATGAGADTTIGIFSGCFFIKNGVPQTLSYWPAGQTYDADTPMWAQYQTIDPDAIYEGQANGSVDQIKLGEAINLADAPVGSSFTGQSTQRLDAATTGAIPGTFIVQNIAPYADNNWGDPFTIVRVRIGTYNDYVWPIPGADLDFEYTTESYYSGSLGIITAAQAMVSDWSSGGLVFDGNGLLQSRATNTAPVGDGRGLWMETSSVGRITFNNTLSNAAWTKTNITAAQDLPSPFSVETPAGWRITATADGGTITHTSIPVAPSASETKCIPYAMLYWDGTPLQGAVEITQDDFVVATDIRSQLVSGQWTLIAGVSQEIASLPDPNVFGIRVAKAGDSVGFCLGNIDRGYTVSTPVLRSGAGSSTRTVPSISVNTANFPSLAGETKFTVLIVVEPRMYPLPPVGDPDKPRIGWTAAEINNPYIVTGTGIGELTPYGGADDGSLMNLDSVDPGSDFAVGNRLLVGTGVGSFTDILTQDSGTPGEDGTYHVYSALPPYNDGQTTPTDIILQSRLKDAMGYGFNSAIKAITFDQQIGVTVTVEAVDQSYGFDPQVAEFVYNEPNAMGFTFDLSNPVAPNGISALKGDTELSNPAQFIAGPVLNSGYIITIGAQYVGGVTGTTAPLDGVIQRVIIFRGTLTEEAISAATFRLQAIYA